MKFVENESDKKESDKKKVTKEKVKVLWRQVESRGDEGRAGQYGILHAIVHTQIFFITTQNFREK